MSVTRAARGGFVTHDGRPTTLGPLIKSGGAGSVYRIVERPDEVAKLYHASVDCAQYERKIGAMLTFTPDLPDIVDRDHRYVQIAWPRALLRDEGRRFVGFTMPLLDVSATSELEAVMQERQARAASLPPGLGAKITLAANLAGVVAALHRQQHYVVDLKPVNLRFYRESLYMAMLDCDGFSIHGEGGRHVAPQVTPDYLAPEFQHEGARTLREEDQDRFALAVVAFQLLNFGIHPYTGRPLSPNVPTDIPARIQGRYYAYGTRAHPGISPGPVSGHAALPASLRALFDRAFEGPGPARPSAREWADALQSFARRSAGALLVCRHDPEHQHFAGLACAACARAALIADARRVAAARPRPRPAPARLPLQPWGKPARHTPPRPAPSGKLRSVFGPRPPAAPPAPAAPAAPVAPVPKRSATYSRRGAPSTPSANPYRDLLFLLLSSRIGGILIFMCLALLGPLTSFVFAPARPAPRIAAATPHVQRALHEGRLRWATPADFADFDAAYARRYATDSPRLSQGIPNKLRAFVIVGNYSFADDAASGVLFLRARAAPRPTAGERASLLLDSEDGTCRGELCPILGLHRYQ